MDTADIQSTVKNTEATTASVPTTTATITKDSIVNGKGNRPQFMMDSLMEKQPSPLLAGTPGSPPGSPRRVRFWEAPPLRSDISSTSLPSPASQNPSPSLSPALGRPASPQMAVNMTAAAKMGLSQTEAERHPLLRRPTREADRALALQQRLKYFRALSKEDESFHITEYPPHVIPPVFGVFDISGGTTLKKQSSLQTIFCVWNTMLGSTLLTMPWGFAHAGILPGTALAVFLWAVSLYTCIIVLRRGNAENTMDFSSLCHTFLGAWANRLYQFASISVFVGAAIAYHNYISSSLESLISIKSKQPLWAIALGSAVVLFLLSIRKDPRFLVRLNSVGILSVLYTMFFIIFEGSPAGSAAHVMGAGESKPQTDSIVPSSFTVASVASLSGILGMSFFIHNAILPIMANNPHRENNVRDLTIAYTLALVCYLAVGLVPNFFVKAENLQDYQNFLKPFPSDHVLACIGRVALVVQLSTVYPLILYLVRIEVFGAVLRRKETYPGVVTVSLTNLSIVGLTTFMAIYVPQVGTVLR
eukprot:c12361_g1_i4.p1 GENE.c12361_g1_i4~~c12361_g1_i4.p1  ORF type:complete len:531 (-),score=144.37 c12361_g1_i4:91-1683(-)